MSEEWKDLLLWNTRRKTNPELFPVVANVIAILGNDEQWHGVIAYNAFTESVVTVKPPPWSDIDRPTDASCGEWTEEDTTRAAAWLSRHEEYSLRVQGKAVDEAVAVIAKRNLFHPVRDWLRTLQWDGTARIDEVFPTYFGARDSEYARAIGSRFLISAVARVERPGCKVDNTVVLEGPQGIGKSTAVRVLAGDAFFFDTPITFGDKDGYQSLRGKWIGELSELEAFNRAEATAAKAFLTASVDHYRPSYARKARDFARQCIFVGTTNSREYLRDDTGNRRFWPLPCGAIDLEGLRRDRDQLWAEAHARYLAGERWHVDSNELRALCEREQEDRFQSDPWEVAVEAWLMDKGKPERRRDGVSSVDVLRDAVGISTPNMTKQYKDRVAKILRRLNWERDDRQERRPDGSRPRLYRPKVVVLVTDPVTPLETRESQGENQVSHASHAPARTRKEIDGCIYAPTPNRNPENAGDTGALVTETGAPSSETAHPGNDVDLLDDLPITGFIRKYGVGGAA